MAMYYVVEFPLEGEKSRGPHIVVESKVHEEANCTNVLWSVVDENGDIKDVYFEANQLKKGSKKECSEFLDRLKKSRENADVINKTERSRKKPARLQDYDDVEDLEMSCSTLKTTQPPPKKKKSNIIYSSSESDEEDGSLFLDKLQQKVERKQKKTANGFSRQNAKSAKKEKKSVGSDKNKRKPNEKYAQKKARMNEADAQSQELAKNIPKRMKIIRQEDDGDIELTITVHSNTTFGSLRTTISKATNIAHQNLVLYLKGKEWNLEDGEDIHNAWSPDDLVAACQKEYLSEGNTIQVIENDTERLANLEEDKENGPPLPVFVQPASSSCKLDRIQQQLMAMQDQLKELSGIVKEFTACTRHASKNFIEKSLPLIMSYMTIHQPTTMSRFPSFQCHLSHFQNHLPSLQRRRQHHLNHCNNRISSQQLKMTSHLHNHNPKPVFLLVLQAEEYTQKRSKLTS